MEKISSREPMTSEHLESTFFGKPRILSKHSGCISNEKRAVVLQE